MSHGLGALLQDLRRLMGRDCADDRSDGVLLDRFVQTQDERAFRELVRRHGNMVLGVCRRVLADPHLAEDAFQSTFLVLVRQGGSIRRRPSVGSWLYGVAYRVAVRVRRQASTRRIHERQAAMVQARAAAEDSPAGDLAPFLDEELYRLPEKYRAPLLLSLQGKSGTQVAEELGCPFGTVASRLARGRELLRKRLARRGLSLGGAALLATAAEAAVPAPLEDAVVRHAALCVAVRFDEVTVTAPFVASITKGEIQAMLVARIFAACAAVVVVAALGIGTALAFGGLSATPLPDAAVSVPDIDKKPAASPPTVKDGVAVTVAPARPAFAPKELLVARVTFTNQTANKLSLAVENPLVWQWSLQHRTTGQRYDGYFMGKFEGWPQRLALTLEPKATHTLNASTENFTYLKNLRPDAGPDKEPMPALPPGKYAVVLRIGHPYAPGNKENPTFTIASNPVEFEIAEK